MTTLKEQHNELRNVLSDLRGMEQNKKEFANENHTYMQQQRLKVENLKKENSFLKRELETTLRLSEQPLLSSTQQEIIRKIHESGEKYSILIEYEKGTISELEAQVQQARAVLLEKQKSIGGSNASRENDDIIRKQISILESRLEKSTARFNDLIAQNKELKVTVEKLRKERSVYDSIQSKLQKDLNEKIQKMTELIESANANYEQRDSYLIEISVLEQTAHRDREEGVKQLEEMQHMLDVTLQLPSLRLLDNSQNTSAPALTNSSEQQTQIKPLQITNSPSNTLKPSSSIHSISTSRNICSATSGILEHAIVVGNSSQKVAINNASQSVHLSNVESVVTSVTSQSYENHQKNSTAIEQSYLHDFQEALNRISEATGITDVNELVQSFLQTEQNNHNMFKYINEQELEVERIQDRITALQKESENIIPVYEGSALLGQQINKLKQQLENTNSMTEKYLVKNHELENALASAVSYIQSMECKLTRAAGTEQLSGLETDAIKLPYLSKSGGAKNIYSGSYNPSISGKSSLETQLTVRSVLSHSEEDAKRSLGNIETIVQSYINKLNYYRNSKLQSNCSLTNANTNSQELHTLSVPRSGLLSESADSCDPESHGEVQGDGSNLFGGYERVTFRGSSRGASVLTNFVTGSEVMGFGGTNDTDNRRVSMSAGSIGARDASQSKSRRQSAVSQISQAVVDATDSLMTLATTMAQNTFEPSDRPLSRAELHSITATLHGVDVASRPGTSSSQTASNRPSSANATHSHTVRNNIVISTGASDSMRVGRSSSFKANTTVTGLLRTMPPLTRGKSAPLPNIRTLTPSSTIRTVNVK